MVYGEEILLRLEIIPKYHPILNGNLMYMLELKILVQVRYIYRLTNLLACYINSTI